MGERQLPTVAYFSMEYGLHSDFKMYAGGLGVLAGDFIKGAKDIGAPLVGVGIKWKQGYTDQRIGEDGRPYDMFTDHEYEFLEDTGITVTVTIKNTEVPCKVWKTEQFGNNPLYLLDTDLPGSENGWITARLYGGGFGEERIAQEIVLGIGGVKALRALNIPVEVYHFNEGHAALAATELIREKMQAGLTFESAWRNTRETVVFTTHTPVKEGNEAHGLDLLEAMSAFNGLSRDQMERIGGNPFNMTVAGLRLARRANAVAALHAETANRMWKDVAGRAEIIGITNAIHLPTWADPRMLRAYDEGGDVWAVHMELKRELIGLIRERSGVELNPERLLIGFSRRAAPYKRSDLIFSRPDLIAPYLESGRIQLVFSGKAHPNDETGKRIVSNLVAMMKRYPGSVVFLENYDMTIGAKLTRGADVWLNNPRRPLEASGTSGMKAAVNGVLNCSILDGWWPEACLDGENGWQIGDGFESADPDELDRHDSAALYDTLLNRVVPAYYEDRPRWVQMMQRSIETTREAFSTKRMLEEYYRKLYMR
ncbi:alpha-glucan family phosphorylase [Paenibacillus phoenicis]|uniref:Alpha-glucan family phosphorylase n=1 Tax=Paenibacillus phoenicis TaxID=554117 RepID=A0ABU5PF82_9BACL|nr:MULTISPECIES: alpha-glucan family phosphorylase [Paenibacillus]EES73630.1 alpha-glucan phosphorylase [Paenibacillus sp. oral taxon 786 str. D14]MCT2193645.1 alpha-glucan family phosphorylase [Paenibacillus sp. p3-SID1389]MEA3568452.1 alpha-glucan family phosphorylase [Paenibacillus phoenicis]